MRIAIVTLFPELFTGFLETSIVGRAVAEAKLTVTFCSPREFGIGRHKSVDDTPYGGGSGMVMRVDVLVAAMESLESEEATRFHRILMTPQGAPLNQTRVSTLASRPNVMLICGRYEGFDERIRDFVDEEISLGDFVMTGGEVAAMAVIEASARLLPGVLGNDDSSREESHSPEANGLLEYPHYTRPSQFRDKGVPAVLLSGNHAEISKYRLQESIARTRQRRPDLFDLYERSRDQDSSNRRIP